VNRSPAEGGIIEANLKIAEDRVLSMVASLLPKVKAKMMVNPNAVFFFEAETSLRPFVFQRRRWINGTVAGYAFLLLTKRGRSWLRNSSFDLKIKIILVLLLIGQLSIYAIVAISPAIFLFCLRFLLLNFTPSFALECTETSFSSICSLQSGFSVLPNILWMTIFILYCSFVVLHSGKNTFHEWSFYVLLIVGAITILGSFIGSIYYLTQNPSQLEVITLVLVYGLMAAPALISLPNPESTWLMIKTFPLFYLFLPMLVAFFGAYSFARTFDFSWGNRDSAAEHMNDALKKLFKDRATSIMVFILLLNVIIVSVFATFGQSQYFLLATVCIIFGFTATQLLLSAIYFSRIFVLKFAGAIFYIVNCVFCLHVYDIDGGYSEENVDENSFLL